MYLAQQGDQTEKASFALQQPNNEYGGSFQLPSPTASSRPSFLPEAQHPQQESDQQLSESPERLPELGGILWRHEGLDPQVGDSSFSEMRWCCCYNLIPICTAMHRHWCIVHPQTDQTTQFSAYRVAHAQSAEGCTVVKGLAATSWEE